MSKEMKANSQRGGAGAKLLIFLTGLILVGHAAINFLPVAYNAQSFKQDMETAVVQGLATPYRAGTPTDYVKQKIERAIHANSIPPNAYVEVKMAGKNLQARVYFVETVNILPFGMYKYQYVFDHTATPTGFLLKDEK